MKSRTKGLKIIIWEAIAVIAFLVCFLLFYPKEAWASQVDGNHMQWNVTEAELVLQYDDRYSFSNMKEGYVLISVENEEVTSCQVLQGEKTQIPDKNVVVLNGDSKRDIIAAGVGKVTALLVPEEMEEQAELLLSGSSEIELNQPIDALQVEITVEPATLTLMFVAGQSNAEGRCSGNLYNLGESIACQPGTVYSTYVPGDQISKSIAGAELTSYCTVDNAEDFVAGALCGDESISEKQLEYRLNALTADGNGKAGIDSGLAYEWYKLTGDKVWIVNSAVGDTYISSWLPGEKTYERTRVIYDLVQKTYQAELDAGHYQAGDRLLFWQQGENDKNQSAQAYQTAFSSMYQTMMKEFDLDALGIIMVRANKGSSINSDDIIMTGPRIAQYAAGASAAFPKAFVVSNVNEQWVSDRAVADYFESAYSEGYLSYPFQDLTASSKLPAAVSQVHNDIHYSQIGHNENGLTAARGMYRALYEEDGPGIKSIQWKNAQGESVSKLRVEKGATAILVPVAEPIYYAKKAEYKVVGSDVSYDEALGILTGNHIGYALLCAYNEHGGNISSVPITVAHPLDLKSVAGRDYTGLFYYNGEWWYLVNGWIQSDYFGLVQNENGWWRVENGKVNFQYDGLAKNAYGWWYVHSGKVDFNYTGLAQNEYGWWYVKKGGVDFSYTGLAQNAYGWWYVKKGGVDFEYTGLVQNEYGWWYVKKGGVDFSYTGLVQNEYGWWYVKKGGVDFSYTGLVQNAYGWWYVCSGRIDFNYTGLVRNAYGHWYIRSGKIDFGYTGYLTVEGSRCYVEEGRVKM